MKYFVCLVAAVLLAGCASLMTSKGKIFNLSTGEVMNGRVERGLASKGKIYAVSAAGENYQGDYVLSSNNDMILNWNGTLEQSKQKNGTCILAGDKGTIIDLKFKFNTENNSGSGEGTDNKGVKYRIQF